MQTFIPSTTPVSNAASDLDQAASDPNNSVPGIVIESELHPTPQEHLKSVQVNALEPDGAALRYDPELIAAQYRGRLLQVGGDC